MSTSTLLKAEYKYKYILYDVIVTIYSNSNILKINIVN